MLEKNVKVVLSVLDGWMGTTFKVVTRKEITERANAQCKCTIEEIDSILNFLLDKQFIEIKFDDGVEVCIATTAKSKAYLQHADSQVTKTKLAKSNFAWMFALIVLASFIGSLLANLII